MGIRKDFVSDEKRQFKFRLGTTIASALTGFIAGALVASMAWAVIIASVR